MEFSSTEAKDKSPTQAKKPEPAKEAPSKKEEKEVGKKAEGAAVESEAKTSDEKSCAALLATMQQIVKKPVPAGKEAEEKPKPKPAPAPSSSTPAARPPAEIEKEAPPPPLEKPVAPFKRPKAAMEEDDEIKTMESSQKRSRIQVPEKRPEKSDTKMSQMDSRAQKKKNLNKLKPGDRISIYWPMEKSNYSGTLVRENSPGQWLIQYDDGDLRLHALDNDHWQYHFPAQQQQNEVQPPPQHLPQQPAPPSGPLPKKVEQEAYWKQQHEGRGPGPSMMNINGEHEGSQQLPHRNPPPPPANMGPPPEMDPREDYRSQPQRPPPQQDVAPPEYLMERWGKKFERARYAALAESRILIGLLNSILPTNPALTNTMSTFAARLREMTITAINLRDGQAAERQAPEVSQGYGMRPMYPDKMGMESKGGLKMHPSQMEPMPKVYNSNHGMSGGPPPRSHRRENGNPMGPGHMMMGGQSQMMMSQMPMSQGPAMPMGPRMGPSNMPESSMRSRGQMMMHKRGGMMPHQDMYMQQRMRGGNTWE